MKAGEPARSHYREGYRTGFLAGFSAGQAQQPPPTDARQDILHLPPGITLKEATRLAEKAIILRAYEECNHNMAAAARQLDISYKGFLNKFHVARGRKRSPFTPATLKLYRTNLVQARVALDKARARRRAARH